MAFNTQIGEAIVAIRGDTSKLKKSLSSAQKTTTAATGKMQQALSNFASRAKIALAAVGVAFIASMRNAVRFADQIDKMSVKTGLAIETIQGLQFASTQLGFSFQLVETLAFRVTRRMGEAAEGNERVSGAFKDLGVSIKDANGRFKDVNEIFPETIDALAKMENKAKRNALAVKIFDTEFRSLLPLIEAGPGALKAMGEEADRLGLIISTDTTDAFVTFGDLVSTSFQQIRASFMNELTPAIIQLNSLLAEYSGTAAQKAQAETIALKMEIEELSAAMDRMSAKRGDTTVYEIMTGEKFEDAQARLNALKQQIEDLNKKKKELNSPVGGGSSEGGEAGGGGDTLAGRRTALVEELRAGTISLEEFRLKLEEINAISHVGPTKLTEALQAGEISVKDFQRLYAEQMKNVESSTVSTAATIKNSFSSAFQQIGSMIGGNNPILGAFLSPILGGLGDSIGGKFGSFFQSAETPGAAALGGPISKPTLVGERGPEMFIPGQAGTVVSNANMGSGVVINQNISLMPDVGKAFKEQLTQAMPVIRSAAIQGVAESNSRRGRGGR
jgi:hypothetical protein